MRGALSITSAKKHAHISRKTFLQAYRLDIARHKSCGSFAAPANRNTCRLGLPTGNIETRK
jgi:hypothetical protein